MVVIPDFAEHVLWIHVVRLAATPPELRQPQRVAEINTSSQQVP
jgi:hypothetical protein